MNLREGLAPLCSCGTHMGFCVFSVCRNVTSSVTVAAVLNTSQLPAEANIPRCAAALAPTLVLERFFLEVSASLEAKTYLILFSQ